LFPVPTKASDLQALCSQFNQRYGTNYTLAQLDPNGLNLGDDTPQIDDQTGGGASLPPTSVGIDETVLPARPQLSHITRSPSMPTPAKSCSSASVEAPTTLPALLNICALTRATRTTLPRSASTFTIKRTARAWLYREQLRDILELAQTFKRLL